MRNPIAKLVVLTSVWVAALIPPVTLATVIGAEGIVIDGYSVVSSRRVGRTLYEYTYTADVSNWGMADVAVTATLASTAANITVLQGNLDFGDVVHGATQDSLGTFVVRIDRRQPFDTDALLWTAQATPLPPTTFELIDSALASGAINAETALVYKVFSEFGDGRLPAQYVGRDENRREATAMQDAIADYATLSAPTQALLEPFLLPPENPASWYQLRLSQLGAQSPSLAAAASDLGKAWTALAAAVTATGCEPVVNPATGAVVEDAIPTANQKVCIHYFTSFPGDSNLAASLSQEVNNTIWPALTGLLGEPLLDANGFLQVYLVNSQNMTTYFPAGALGLATICSGSVPKVFLNRDNINNKTRKAINQTAAHEITHAITARYNRIAACGEARWLGEATATWAEHFVYPCAQTEQPYAPRFLDTPAVSLEDGADSLHPYAAYLWFLYMTKVTDGPCTPGGRSSDPAYVPRVWSALTSFDSLHAIDLAIGGSGGLRKQWHEFVLYNWNRDQKAGKPYSDYRKSDRLKHKAKESPDGMPIEVRLAGAVARPYALSHLVRHLAATYYHFDLTKDKTIRRVRLLHLYSYDTTGSVMVQAILKTDKGWQKAEDWTGLRQKTLCRDKDNEKFKELVIVISNSEFDDRSAVLSDNGSATKLQVSALGCSNWQGWATGNFTTGDANPVEHVDSSTNAQGVKFERYLEGWSDADDWQLFRTTGGTVTWTHAETFGGPTAGFTCTGSFSGSYGLANVTNAEAQLVLGIARKPDYDITGRMQSTEIGGTLNVNLDNYRLTCPPILDPLYYNAHLDEGDGLATWLRTSDGVNFPGINDTAAGDEGFAKDLAGSYIVPSVYGEAHTYSWQLMKDGTFSDP